MEQQQLLDILTVRLSVTENTIKLCLCLCVFIASCDQQSVKWTYCPLLGIYETVQNTGTDAL